LKGKEMSDLQSALLKAVSFKPQIERVWLYLKDHPDSPAKRVRAELKLDSASTLLSQLEDRGMVASSLFSDNFGTRKVYRAIGQTYEMLPRKVKKPEQETPVKQSKLDSMTVKEARETWAQLDKFFSTMTASEIRELYEQLNKMFKGNQNA
jgi:hypothetical protein